MPSATAKSQHPRKPPILDIPTKPETWPSFCHRLESLLSDPRTHVYIDTSFLMWLTQVGSESRNELFAWFRDTLPSRIHVPVWAAHEYIKHDVNQTVLKNFQKTHGEVSRITRNTYAEMRPYLDEPLGNVAQDPATLLVSVHDTLNQLGELLDQASKWPEHYERNSTEVLSFINESSPKDTTLYSNLSTVADNGEVRLTSSVPPGYKDLNKRSRSSSSGQAESARGTNEYGDLMFWKEILSHASSMNASGVLIISNDVKNDWLFGGRKNTAATDPELNQLRASWKPIPTPHPLLVLEARLQADIRELILIDSRYLGLYLRKATTSNTKKFADVALVPDTPVHTSDLTQTDRPDSGETAELRTRFQDRTDELPLFPDPDTVSATRPKLTTALRRSREEPAHQLIETASAWAAESATRSKPDDLFMSVTLEGLDQSQLAALARLLHDRSLEREPGYRDACTTLLSILPKLPDNTAASLYLGFLASQYLDRHLNTSRIPPRSPHLEQLFRLQKLDSLRAAISVVEHRLKDNEYRPIYIPALPPTPIALRFETNPDGESPSQLAQLSVELPDQPEPLLQLLTPVQSDPTLNLATLSGGEAAVGGNTILNLAYDLFALPSDVVPDHPSFEHDYALTEEIGFRRPSEVLIVKEQSNAS